MAKELPYFKFEPNQWENGNIQLCTREEKGLFMDLCSVYWSRLGDLPYKLAVQKVCGGNATALDSLISDDHIKCINGDICIDFLNEQLGEFEDTSKQNSKNAREGWVKRRKNKENEAIQCDRNATASNPQCESDAIREEKRREENNNNEQFDIFWSQYGKKVGKEKAKKRFNNLTEEETQAVMDNVPKYVASREVKYRKDPERYLSNRTWEDDIPTQEGDYTKNVLGW